MCGLSTKSRTTGFRVSDPNRYKTTIHLPATEFPMRGDLPKRVP